MVALKPFLHDNVLCKEEGGLRTGRGIEEVMLCEVEESGGLFGGGDSCRWRIVARFIIPL